MTTINFKGNSNSTAIGHALIEGGNKKKIPKWYRRATAKSARCSVSGIYTDVFLKHTECQETGDQTVADCRQLC